MIPLKYCVKCGCRRPHVMGIQRPTCQECADRLHGIGKYFAPKWTDAELQGMTDGSLKLCSKCKRPKPVTEFAIARNQTCGRRPNCKACSAVIRKAEWNTDPALREERRYVSIKNRFGITKEEYVWLWTRQNGICAICKQPPNRIALAIDHDHAHHKNTKQGCRQCIRGLLCSLCNFSAVPTMERIPEFRTERAKAYLSGRPFIDDISAPKENAVTNADMSAVTEAIEKTRQTRKQDQAEPISGLKMIRRIMDDRDAERIGREVSPKIFAALESAGL